jgi:dTDP-4-amino-4,6-dideoxygalactose transaminase
MLDSGVSTRRAVMSSHLERPWARARCGDLIRSEQASGTHMILPLFDAMTDKEQVAVADALSYALSKTEVKRAA